MGDAYLQGAHWVHRVFKLRADSCCMPQVWLTDLEEVIPLLEFNIALNRARGLTLDVEERRGRSQLHSRQCAEFGEIRARA